MSEIKILDKGEKFAHASVGNLTAFEGKQFMKDAIGATSCEVSFGTLSTGTAIPFFHSHKSNEEIYIVLSGSGKFQVDGNIVLNKFRRQRNVQRHRASQKSH